jgi:hypothetical protein
VSRARTAWIAAAALLLAALARLPLLTRQGLWVDEVFSLAMATGHSLEHPAARRDASLGDFVEGSTGAPGKGLGAPILEPRDEPAGPGRVRARRAALGHEPAALLPRAVGVDARARHERPRRCAAFSLACALACLPCLARLAAGAAAAQSRAAGAAASYALAPLSVYYGTEGRMYALLWLCVLACAAFTPACSARGVARHLPRLGRGRRVRAS